MFTRFKRQKFFPQQYGSHHFDSRSVTLLVRKRGNFYAMLLQRFDGLQSNRDKANKARAFQARNFTVDLLDAFWRIGHPHLESLLYRITVL